MILLLSTSLGNTSANQLASPQNVGPRIDFASFRLYKNEDDALKAAVNGEIDFLAFPISADKVPQVRGNSNLRLLILPDFEFSFIGLNLRRHPLSNARFRQAMMFAFEREKLVSDLLGQNGEVLPPGLMSSAYGALGWQNQGGPQYKLDLERAAKLLDQAGFVLSPGSKTRIDPLTSRPLRDIILMSRTDNPFMAKAARAFAEAMQRIGIPVINQPTERRTISRFVERLYDFDMFTGVAPVGPEPDWLYDFFDSSQDIAPVPLGTNVFGYRNATYDSLARRVKFGLSSDDAKNAALKAQEILASEIPVIPIYSPKLILATSPQWEGFVSGTGLANTVWWSILNAKRRDSDYGSTLRVGLLGQVDSLNPFAPQGASSWLIMNQIFESLISLDPSGREAPRLAESWIVEPLGSATAVTGEAITFFLRKNILFSDGSKLTSTDVKRSLEWLRDAGGGSDFWSSSVRFVERIETVDESTVKVYLSLSSPFAARWIGRVPILPAGLLSGLHEPSTTDYVGEGLLTGAGPLVLADFEPPQRIRLHYNVNYYQRIPEHVFLIPQLELTVGERMYGFRLTPGDTKSFDSRPLLSEGKPIIDAKYTLRVRDFTGRLISMVNGTYRGQGVYTAKLSADSIGTTSGRFLLEESLVFRIGTQTHTLTDVTELMIREPAPLVQIVLVAAILLGIVVLFVVRRQGRIEPGKRFRVRVELKKPSA